MFQMLRYERELYEQAVQDASYTKHCCVRWHYASTLFNGSGRWRHAPLRKALLRLHRDDWELPDTHAPAKTLLRTPLRCAFARLRACEFTKMCTV